MKAKPLWNHQNSPLLSFGHESVSKTGPIGWFWLYSKIGYSNVKPDEQQTDLATVQQVEGQKICAGSSLSMIYTDQ